MVLKWLSHGSKDHGSDKQPGPCMIFVSSTLDQMPYRAVPVWVYMLVRLLCLLAFCTGAQLLRLAARSHRRGRGRQSRSQLVGSVRAAKPGLRVEQANMRSGHCFAGRPLKLPSQLLAVRCSQDCTPSS